MKKLNYYLTLIICFALLGNLKSQSNLVEYSFGFEFVEGVYQSFDEFKNNSPSVTKYEMITGNAFWVDMTVGNRTVRKIEYIDSAGQQQTLRRYDIWGVCYKGNIYICIDGYLKRVNQIGAILYIRSQKSQGYKSLTLTGADVGQYMKSFRYLLDFQTGKLLTFSEDDILPILKRDKVLFEEYNSDKRGSNIHMLFSYVLKYNQRNPIYFPVKD